MYLPSAATDKITTGRKEERKRKKPESKLEDSDTFLCYAVTQLLKDIMCSLSRFNPKWI